MPCGGFLLRACIPPVAGLYTPCCGFLYAILRVSVVLYALLWVSTPPIARFYTPYCGFLYPLLWISIRSIVGFYTIYCGFLYPLLWVSIADFYAPCFGFLHALLRCYPHSISLPTGAEVTLCG